MFSMLLKKIKPREGKLLTNVSQDQINQQGNTVGFLWQVNVHKSSWDLKQLVYKPMETDGHGLWVWSIYRTFCQLVLNGV